TILTPKDLQAVYGLPQLTDEERQVYFTLDPQEKQTLNEYRTITARVYFILQLGYFKAKKQFFVFGLQEFGDDVLFILNMNFPAVSKLPSFAISKPTRGYRFKPGHPAFSITCRDGLTALSWHGQLPDL